MAAKVTLLMPYQTVIADRHRPEDCAHVTAEMSLVCITVAVGLKTQASICTFSRVNGKHGSGVEGSILIVNAEHASGVDV